MSPKDRPRNPSLYLAKDGQISGPFTVDQINAIRSSGELRSYSWIWDDRFDHWQPIDPAPPHRPLEVASSSQSAIDTLLGILPSARSPIEAICHNSHDLLGGTMRNISEMGCEFVASDAVAASPVFAEKTPVVLNLIHTESEFMGNITALLSSCFREDGKWVYHLKWHLSPNP